MIDVARCMKALEHIRVVGRPDGTIRQQAIERAICAIGQDGATAIRDQYIGVKNYAHFGDQREDHPYGYGPKHGTIVFKIGRNRNEGSQAIIGSDEIYLLECVRDFGPWEDEPHSPNTNVKDLNLCDLLIRREQAGERLFRLDAVLSGATVESNVSA